MAEVIFKNVVKTFGKTTAVDNFSLHIVDGEFIVLVGPSGCGKSTTLRLIAGLEVVTSGEMIIGDRIVNEVHPRDRDIAMVFQNYALYPQMTVRDNMSFSLKMRKVPKDDIHRTIQKAADLLRIEKLLDRKPGQLSGGQRQRVALGRAIVRDPQVFLFDEPLSNLDAKLRIAMRAELLELHQRLKTTIIYVTHDQLEAMTMGSRIVVMKDGLIQQVDVPDRVYNQPVNKFVGGFIGSPSMNFINCHIVPKADGVFAQTRGLSLKIPEQFVSRVERYLNARVTLGVRPEHITDIASVQDPDPYCSFKAAVRVIESAGSEKLVHIRVGDDTMIARLDPHVRLSVGEEASFSARMASAHVFDVDSGDTVF